MPTNDFTTLPSIAWTSDPLVNFEINRRSVAKRFGPPQLRDCDSNGVGLFDAWLLGFDCGLEVALWLFHDDALSAGTAELHANSDDLDHILLHLDITHGELHRWVPDNCPPLPKRYVLMRQDDNGVRYEVTRATSECEMTKLTREYEARGHKQTYWWERADAES